jgi:hypothetical protein
MYPVEHNLYMQHKIAYLGRTQLLIDMNQLKRTKRVGQVIAILRVADSILGPKNAISRGIPPFPQTNAGTAP